jgi:hypothetical protein
MASVTNVSAVNTSFPAKIANYYEGSRVQQVVNPIITFLGGILATMVKYKVATALVGVVVVGCLAYKYSATFRAEIDKLCGCDAASSAGGKKGPAADNAGGAPAAGAKDSKDGKAADPV